METGEIQCYVFYCDPMNTNQKSNCERNHEFIYYIIPKNHPKDEYREEEIREMMNHINFYPRKMEQTGTCSSFYHDLRAEGYDSPWH